MSWDIDQQTMREEPMYHIAGIRVDDQVDIPCCVGSWPYPKQFVEGQGTGALNSARSSQPVEPEASSFPYNQ